ncbi:unnamed protein product [Clonostachys rosea f. rosea IK726]|uniref:Uncharacterized protein n=1 Tax=Clonostachys rosea f. rosea IK726 TaxID=1349383 RepID=A0ACA9TGD7_BIOOC|nr:unnamed protein product [Clonostachys rosea f. rosea IK726]
MATTYIQASAVPVSDGKAQLITETASPALESVVKRRFDIKKPNVFTHYDIYPEDSNTMLHFVSISNFTSNKPDLTLHAGSDTQAPVLAVSHMPMSTRHFKIGLSNSSSSPLGDDMEWENLEKQSVKGNEYHMVFPMEDGRRWELAWKRTHGHAVDNKETSSLSMRDWKLVDLQTGQVVALFTNERWSIVKTGTVQINGEFGRGFDQLVFITVLSLYEKVRRRHQRGAWHELVQVIKIPICI